PLHSEHFSHHDQRAVLVHATEASGLCVAVGMDHLVDGPVGIGIRTESGPDLGRLIITAHLEPGQRLQVVKFLGYGWSSRRSVPALRDQVEGALAAARHRGWAGLLADQRSYLQDFWNRADVEVDGDAQLQQAV